MPMSKSHSSVIPIHPTSVPTEAAYKRVPPKSQHAWGAWAERTERTDRMEGPRILDSMCLQHTMGLEYVPIDLPLTTPMYLII